MSKKLLSAAIAAAVALPMAAQAEIKLSGTIQAEVGNIEVGTASALTTTQDGTGALAGGGPNRVGFDFSEDLGGGLKAYGRIDWAFNTTNNTGGSFSDREKYVGLKGGSGAYFRMGRIQGAYKTTDKIDPFYSTVGQMRIGGGESSGDFSHGGFLNNITELGFAGGGFKVALQGVFSDDGNDATALVDDGIASRSGSMLANASYSNDMFTGYGAFSKDEAKNGVNDTNWKVGAKASFGGVGVGVQYEDAENNSSVMIRDPGTYVSGSLTYGIGGIVLGGWVSQFSGDNNAADAMSYAAGGLYNLSKKTFVYAAYHSVDRDGSDTGDLSGFAAGVRHNF